MHKLLISILKENLFRSISNRNSLEFAAKLPKPVLKTGHQKVTDRCVGCDIYFFGGSLDERYVNGMYELRCPLVSYIHRYAVYQNMTPGKSDLQTITSKGLLIFLRKVNEGGGNEKGGGVSVARLNTDLRVIE